MLREGLTCLMKKATVADLRAEPRTHADGQMNRRHFIKLTAKAAAASVLGGSIYGVFEAKWLRVTRVNIALPNLPQAFRGMNIAFVADFHHSEMVPANYIKRAVSMVNALGADLILLGGDYVTAGRPLTFWGVGPKYIQPCFEILKNLHARYGVFAVAGNHDSRAGIRKVNEAIAEAGFENLTNRGVWLERDGARLRICGVGDLVTQRQDVATALAGVTDRDAALLLTHNPDALEYFTDRRIGLALCGHTHGGQVALPVIGSPIVPSGYGNKYRYGMVHGPHVGGYVTSGVGTLPLAIRINCRPEIALLTLT